MKASILVITICLIQSAAFANIASPINTPLVGGVLMRDGVVYPAYAVVGKSYVMGSWIDAMSPQAAAAVNINQIIAARKATGDETALNQVIASAQYLTSSQINSLITKGVSFGAFNEEPLLDTTTALNAAQFAALGNALAAIANGDITSSSITKEQAEAALLESLKSAREGQENVDYSNIDFSTKNLQFYPNLWQAGLNFSRTNVTAGQLAGNTNLAYTNLSGIDMSEFDFSGVTAYGVNLSNTQLTAVQINSLSGVWTSMDLSGNDFTGVSFVGKALPASLAYSTGIDITSLNQASTFAGANLSGLDLRDFITTGKSLNGVNFSGATVTTTQLNAASDIRSTHLAGVDLEGINSSRSLYGVDFTGAIGLTVAMLNNATNLQQAVLTRVNMAGFITAGKDLTGVNISNATGITAASLAEAAVTAGMDLTGTGITEANFTAELQTAGKNPEDFNYQNMTFTDGSTNIHVGGGIIQ